MNEQPKRGHTLRQWQSRQKSDGQLVWIMVFVSLFTAVQFLVSPGAGSAFVMGLFLFGLGIACVRLLISAAKVAEIRHARSLHRSEVRSDPAALTSNAGLRQNPSTHWTTGRESLN